MNAGHKNRYLAAAAAAVLMLSACTSGADRYALREEAVALYQSGDYAGAIEKLDEALDASDGQVSELQYDILKYKAECQLRTGDFDGARISYEALIEVDDKTQDKSDYEELVSELDSISAIEDAEELFEGGQYAEVAEIFREYAALDGSVSGKTAWFNLAVTMEYSGDFDEAAKLLRQFTAAYPDDEAARKEAEFAGSRAAEE